METKQRTDLSDISLREWQQVQRHCEEALEHSGGTHDWQDIMRALLSGKMQLWTTPVSTMVTEVVAYPKLKACRIFLASGKLDDVLTMADDVAEAAAHIGCTRMEFTGRLGWTRALRDRGWRPHGSCTKEIGHG